MFGACWWTRNRKATLVAVLGVSTLFFGIPRCTAEQPANPPKRVLILYSFDNEQIIYTGFDHVVRSQLRMRVRSRLEFYTEHLDLIRFPAAAHAAETVTLLKLKYAQRKPDLIIPVSYAALKFLLTNGRELFPNVPMVTLFNQRRLGGLQRSIAEKQVQGVTGVASSDDPAGTIDMALRLQPETKQIAIVIGSSSVEQFWIEQFKSDLAPYAGKVEIAYLTGLSLDKLLERVANLPPHTVIFCPFFFQDATGQFFFTEEVLDLLAREAHSPVYGIYSSYIGHGVVGGRMTNPEVTGRKVADLAAAVLNGENAGKIPIVLDDPPQNTIDWHELKRWGISESRVPPGTLQLFRESSVWERYRSALVAGVLVFVLQFVLLVGLVLNVRHRRRAEMDLEQAKKLSEAVIETLPGIFVLQDDQGRNVRWNRNAETLARYPLSSNPQLGNISEEYREAVRVARQRALEQGVFSVEADFLTADGRKVPFYLTGSKVELQGKSYVAAVGIDLTERNEAQQALRRTESEMQSLVEHAPYGIATIDVQQDRFLHANPAMVKLLGYESEAELQRLAVSRDLYPDSDPQGYRAQPTRAEFFRAVEFTWKRKDGKPVHVRASGRRISQAQGQRDLIEIIAEDITARRQLEDQLRQAQKMEALGRLSGSIAHDFNNLLGVVIGYSELLSLNPASDATMKLHLGAIKKAGERAASLTAQLLAFSRSRLVQPSVVNLNSLIRETEKMLRRLMREDIEFQLSLDPQLWKTKADPGQMVQVLMNLGINARDAMPKGGTLAIRTGNAIISGSVALDGVQMEAGSYLELSVSDTGVGMDSATRSRIFEPFFTTKEDGKGTGLGLATVYGIVKQSGGYVFADSELGKGTTFTIYLPQYNGNPQQDGQRPGAGTQPSSAVHSHTLLVVEDETAFRDLLRDGLRAKGYQVLVAANGVEALQLAEQHKGKIGVLVTDVIMPQMSGAELASTLRKTRPGTKVLYISGYTDDKFREDDTASSELTLIQKPFYIDELAGKIRDILAGQ